MREKRANQSEQKRDLKKFNKYTDRGESERESEQKSERTH